MRYIVEVIINVVEFTISLTFFVLSGIYAYRLLTSKEERKKYRTKIQRQFVERRNELIKKNSESKLQLRLRMTGLPISAFVFQVIRWSLIVVSSGYYILTPLFTGQKIDLTIVSIPIALIIFTEASFKYSLTSKLLEMLINRKRRSKIIEMFQLFDLLKAELISLKPGQEVNIYYILKDSLPMFEHINGTISKFLSFWRSDPNKAREVFLNDIGGDSTRILGEILFKMDKASKDDALAILEAESHVFSYDYFEGELQNSNKQRLGFFALFMTTNIVAIAWLVLLVLSMFTTTLNQTGLN